MSVYLCDTYTRLHKYTDISLFLHCIVLLIAKYPLILYDVKKNCIFMQ